MSETENIGMLQKEIYDLAKGQFPRAAAVHFIVRPGEPTEIHVRYGVAWKRVAPSPEPETPGREIHDAVETGDGTGVY